MALDLEDKSSEGNLEGLKTFYQNNTEARLVLEHFKGRQRGYEIQVERLEQLIKLPRRAIVDVLKEFEGLGFGEFISGRHGHPSRFRSKVSIPVLGKAATGESHIENVSSSPLAPGELRVLEHSFRLRPNYEVTIVLPVDLTTHEAGRLADFIKALPFNAVTGGVS